MLKIKNTGRFDKEYRLLVQDNPELAGLVTKQVELFVTNLTEELENKNL